MDLSHMNFIVADDDTALLEIVTAALRTFGAGGAKKCASGVAVIEAITERAVNYHCIISDYSMAPVTGLDLLQGVRIGRYDGVPRDLPFIMMTVSGKEEVVRAALALDVSAYLMKPVNQSALNKAINRATGKLMMLKSPEEYAAVKVS
jgi:two-component system, chemotaxis family, chemotaxis protein CheY